MINISRVQNGRTTCFTKQKLTPPSEGYVGLVLWPWMGTDMFINCTVGHCLLLLVAVCVFCRQEFGEWTNSVLFVSQDRLSSSFSAVEKHKLTCTHCIQQTSALCFALASLRYDKPSAGARIWWQYWHHVLPGQCVCLRSLCAGSGWSHCRHLWIARRWVQSETSQHYHH